MHVLEIFATMLIAKTQIVYRLKLFLIRECSILMLGPYYSVILFEKQKNK